ncbi:protein BTG3 [Dunckerocampus dactyliophorus]|uniref:protein BTG3 n=1 Tax=Dunckerocampus dactyliophorus TaxID=161453 RepID=UPI0024073B69|nr:protein BTG3 [Dunckerocampus dactyliophorus]
MKKEITAAVHFLKKLVLARGRLQWHQIELFIARLTVALHDKFQGHWYPGDPGKGQAYRCIRVNRYQREDPELLRACRESGVHYCDLGLPLEVTLWVNPGEVYCRHGENSFCFLVASFNDDEGGQDPAKKVTSIL